jgi:hypothetical protein
MISALFNVDGERIHVFVSVGVVVGMVGVVIVLEMELVILGPHQRKGLGMGQERRSEKRVGLRTGIL